MSAAERKLLHMPAAWTFVAVLLLGGGLVYYTHGLLQSARQQYVAAQARIQLQTPDAERQTFIDYLDDYRALENAGFAGDERRMNWLDGLRATNRQLHLFGIAYQIDAQQPYAHADAFHPGALTMRASVMKLSLSLLHEGDLARFLTTLAAQHVGIFAPEQCTLTRIETDDALRDQPNLRAECDLDWITVQAPPRAAS